MPWGFVLIGQVDVLSVAALLVGEGWLSSWCCRVCAFWSPSLISVAKHCIWTNSLRTKAIFKLSTNFKFKNVHVSRLSCVWTLLLNCYSLEIKLEKKQCSCPGQFLTCCSWEIGCKEKLLILNNVREACEEMACTTKEQEMQCNTGDKPGMGFRC